MRRKLRTRSGSTLVFAMSVFLSLTILSAALLTGMVSDAEAEQQRRQRDQTVRSIRSAATVLQSVIKSDGVWPSEAGSSVTLVITPPADVREALCEVTATLENDGIGVTATLTATEEAPPVTLTLRFELPEYGCTFQSPPIVRWSGETENTALPAW